MNDVKIEGYEPFDEMEVCSNLLLKMRSLFTFDGIDPVLIGKGEKPLIWLAVRKNNTLTWRYIVQGNRVLNDRISLDITCENKTRILVENTILIEAEKVTENRVRITNIDLRPLGLNVYCQDNQLNVGAMHFRDSEFENSVLMIETPYPEIVTLLRLRFPDLFEGKREFMENKQDLLKTLKTYYDSREARENIINSIDAKNFFRVLEERKE